MKPAPPITGLLAAADAILAGRGRLTVADSALALQGRYTDAAITEGLAFLIRCGFITPCGKWAT